MTSLARRGISALAAAAVTGCAGCVVPGHHGPAPAHPRPATATRPACAPAPGAVTPLPVSPAQLETAAVLAARFAAAYDTHQPTQPPSAWVARLAPMATSQLTGALTRAAATQATGPATTGQAADEQIRDLAPTSVIFTVQVRQASTTAPAPSASTDALAVTVTRRNGGGWAVYDIEPANAGNTGGATDAAGP